jgi:hypothetical protein
LDKSLKVYASAAAAGVGLLTFAQSAEAKVVFTPKHATLLPGQVLNLDLNADGVNDFAIGDHRVALGTFPSYGSLLAAAAGQPFSNRILFGSLIGSSAFAKVLPPNVTLSSQQRFVNYPLRMAYCLGRSNVATHREGRWAGATDRYLALEFYISGQPHFGWARFTVRLEAGLGCSFEAMLSGYAYETVPNKPIVTGQTMDVAEVGSDPSASSTKRLVGLGTLALGAPGLSIWRREEEPKVGL